MKTLFAAALTATVALSGVSATPAVAQDRGYSHYQDRGRGGYENYQRGYDNRGYRGDRRQYRGNQRCGSGTTGAIVGGVLGALLGGEVGRGSGYYDQRSGTGTIIGAGAGALLGREIDRGDCNNGGRRGYRR